MKRIIYLLIIILLLIPTIVSATDLCDSSNIVIESIELNNIKGKAVENSSSKIVDNKMVTDVSFNALGDSVKYDITVLNKSNEDYYINDNDIVNNSKYLDYKISYDGNNVIKSKKDKKISVEIKYKNEVNEDYNSNENIIFKLSDKDNIKNPLTGNSFIYIVLILLLLIMISIFIRKKRVSRLIIITIMFLIPISVFALCKYNLEMTCKVSINKKYTGFAYLYNERGRSRVGAELDNTKTTRWCSVDADDEDYSSCALWEGYSTEEECVQYNTTYNYDKVCVPMNNRLYDHELLFYDTKKLQSIGKYYIKFYMENGVIKEVYNCFIDNGQDYCLKGTEESYQTNKEILMNNQSLFGYCEFEDDHSVCRHGINELLFYISMNSNGTVFIGNSYDAFCGVAGSGEFYCTD